MTTTSLYVRLCVALMATALVGLFLLVGKSDAATVRQHLPMERISQHVLQPADLVPYGF